MEKNTQNLTWTTEEKKLLCKTAIMTVNSQRACSPDGRWGDYIVIDSTNWVIVVPILTKALATKHFAIQKDCFLMVEQWRHGAKSLSMEFPGGVIDLGEDTETAAKRELLEETGFDCKKIVSMGSMNPNPAIFSNQVHFFAALLNEKIADQNLDADEYVAIHPIEVNEVQKKMGRIPYINALMGTALQLYLSKKPF